MTKQQRGRTLSTEGEDSQPRGVCPTQRERTPSTEGEGLPEQRGRTPRTEGEDFQHTEVGSLSLLLYFPLTDRTQSGGTWVHIKENRMHTSLQWLLESFTNSMSITF